MDAVVGFRNFTSKVPAQAKRFRFNRLEPVKFLNQVQVKRRAYPSGKLQSNVLVAIRAPISPGIGKDANRSRFFYPFVDGQHKRATTCPLPNPIKIHGIKTGIVKAFPGLKKIEVSAVPQITLDDGIRSLVSMSGYVSQAKIVLPVVALQFYFRALNV